MFVPKLVRVIVVHTISPILQVLPFYVFLFHGSSILIEKFSFAFKTPPCPRLLHFEYGDFSTLMRIIS